jgi:AcrR family transcriptional regulator
MRERFRVQVRDEVKAAALRQLADGGPEGVSVNAIAKQLGVSGPALYRYFASRDALVGELVIDAYRDLAGALEAVAADGPGGAPAERLRALLLAYRAWAVAQPHRYRLLFGPPLPGSDAHAPRIVDASHHSMATLLAGLSALGDAPPAPPPRLAPQLEAWGRSRGLPVDPALGLRAVALWATIHGLVSLELGGNFASMGLDAEALFEAELARLLP